MYDTATRVKLVKKRIRQKQRAREQHIIHGLSALCLLLFVSLAGVIGAASGYGHCASLSLYGSILLYKDAGGYVLVGILSFTAAVIITVFCIRYRKRKHSTPKKEEKL